MADQRDLFCSRKREKKMKETDHRIKKWIAFPQIINIPGVSEQIEKFRYQRQRIELSQS